MPPLSFDEFIAGGGMQGIERAAAERAVAGERETWLRILQAWAALLNGEDDLLVQVQLAAEIRRLQRLLGLPPELSREAMDRRRIQTRERVRRYRQRLRRAAE